MRKVLPYYLSLSSNPKSQHLALLQIQQVHSIIFNKTLVIYKEVPPIDTTFHL